MAKDLLVSVIIPTYNRAKQVCSAIESVLAQTYSPVEIIVVDDGSTDDTHEALHGYGRDIRVIRQVNAGPSAARNVGVQNSRGKLIAFLDSDDLWLRDRLAVQFDLLSKVGQNLPCCLCNVRLDRADSQAASSFEIANLHSRERRGIWLNPFEVLATRFVFFNQAVLMRREAFENAGGFNKRLRFLEDYDLALRLAVLGPWAFTAEQLVIWQQSADSLSRRALSEVALLKECELGIRHRIVSTGRGLADHAERGKLMNNEIRRNQRELALARRSQSRSRWMRGLTTVLSTFEKSRHALYRRSPRYPRMQVAPLDQYGGFLRAKPEAALRSVV